MRPASGAWVLSILVAMTACAAPAGRGRDSGVGDGTDGAPTDARIPGVDAGIPTRDAFVPMADAGVDAGPIDRVAFCMGAGPVATVGDATMETDTCAGAIATRVFDNSVCSCEDTNIVGYLRTRSFDSGTGMSDTAAGAPVGVNGNYITGGYADIGGTFVVAGSSGVDFGGYLKVGGDAFFNGDVDAIGRIDVDRDLWVEGDVLLIGPMNVDRDLHQPSGRDLLTFTDIGGSTIRTPFTIDPPCACEPADLVDIDAIVADGVLNNDNADVSLDPALLENVIGLGEEITLPCGRFHLTSIGGLGDITIRVTGRTALFIDGDVNALGVFDIELDPDAELDMFIRGDLLAIGAGSFGDRAQPAKTRIYVGGSGDVTLVGASGFVGNVYAPHARIIALGATTVYGSLFGREIDMPGYLDVHYDRAILDVDRDCPPPPTDECGCGIGEGCTDHLACISGECSACSSDADCCAPLVCYTATGTCGPLLL